MYKESEVTELKVSLNEHYLKSVVSFLNTNGGSIHVGVSDTGEPVGVNNHDEDMKKISDIITDQISPNPTHYIDVKLEDVNGKKIITTIIKKATGLFYIKKYGHTEKGCYIRIGTTNKSMTKEQIDKLYIESLDIPEKSIVTQTNRHQDLNFFALKDLYRIRGFNLNDDTFARNLSLVDSSGKHNILAGILADVNDVSIKVVRFNGKDKADGIAERTEYGYVSLISAVNRVLDRLVSINITKTTLTGSAQRIDKKLINPYCLREAFLNAIVHNDWIDGTPPAVYIFDDRVEIISTGGLPKDLTKEEFFDGVSKPTNRELIRIFRDLEFVEQTRYGIRKIVGTYGKEVFKISENFIIVKLPYDEEVMAVMQSGQLNIQQQDKSYSNLANKEDLIIEYISEHGQASRKEIETLLSINDRTARRVLSQMVKNNHLEKKGSARSVIYIVKNNRRNWNLSRHYLDIIWTVSGQSLKRSL